MPEHRIPEKHKQGNRASFVVQKREIATTSKIGYDLAVQWIASRGRLIRYETARSKDINASKELRDTLASLPSEKSRLLVEGRLQGTSRERVTPIPGEVWSQTAVSDCEEAKREYEWRVEGLGGGDWSAVLANLKNPFLVYTELHIDSEFILQRWPSLVQPKPPGKQKVLSTKVIKFIEELHSLLRDADANLIPLTLAEAEEILACHFPNAGKRRLRDIYRKHRSTGAPRGRIRKVSERIQRLKEFREKLDDAALKP